MSVPFISFEGGEGVGKSTQIRLLATRLARAGYQVCCLREPGGTVIGEQVRRILLDVSHTNMAPVAELLLYEAARAQLVSEVIQPALAEDTVVLVDRFYDSTIAYQSFARGLDRALVERANMLGSGGLAPTRTIVLERDVDHGLEKATENGADRLEAEGREFHALVHNAFKLLAQQYPERIVTVPCQPSKEDTHALVFAAVADLFNAEAAVPFEITAQLLQEVKDAR